MEIAAITIRDDSRRLTATIALPARVRSTFVARLAILTTLLLSPAPSARCAEPPGPDPADRSVATPAPKPPAGASLQPGAEELSSMALPLVAPAVARRTAADGRTVLLETLGPDVPAPGARCWLFEKLKPVARLTTTLRRGRLIAGQVDWFDPACADVLAAGRWRDLDASALHADAARRGRDRLVPRGPIWAQVGPVCDSGRVLWLRGGPAEGLRVGDIWLVERDGWPVARLEVTDADRRAALAAVTPLVANMRPQPGDWARLWLTPRERRCGDAVSRVLRVEPRGAEQRIWIPYPHPDVAAVDDAWILTRDGAYAGVVRVVQVTEEFAVAETLPSLGRTQVTLGDLAVRRPSADVLGGRVPLLVFRAEGGYGLINAGEGAGLRPGMSLALLRGGEPVARLTVAAAHEDHCGVNVEASLVAGLTLQPWDELYVDFARLPAERWGAVTHVDAAAGVCFVRAEGKQTDLRPGLAASVRSQRQDSAAVVLRCEQGEAVLAPPAGPLPPWIAVGDAIFVDGPAWQPPAAPAPVKTPLAATPADDPRPDP